MLERYPVRYTGFPPANGDDRTVGGAKPARMALFVGRLK
jgi:hypothetical protein